MKRYPYIILWVFAFVLQLQAQTTIKVMSYNLLHYPTGTGTDRKDDLKYILDSYQPDIFMACEIEDGTGADEILDYCLGTEHYSDSYFTYNHSGSYHLQQMLYYNHHKFELTHETYLLTYIRDINHYTLKLKTSNGSPEVYIEVYVAHLKASGGTDNEDIREDMVNVLLDDLHNIPADHFVIFGGDFNLYSSDEPAYQALMDATNAVVLKDPINRPGSWHNNYDFRDIQTQSTHSASESNSYVGGGIDDRFDFLLISENLTTSPLLYYVSDSYAAYGNNGTCFNKAITSSYCNGGNYDFSLRSHLYQMSDHLPVVMTLETTASLSSELWAIDSKLFYINGTNPVHQYLNIGGAVPDAVQVKIYAISGQQIKSIPVYHLGEPIDLLDLETGIYFVSVTYQNQNQILKFVKTD